MPTGLFVTLPGGLCHPAYFLKRPLASFMAFGLSYTAVMACARSILTRVSHGCYLFASLRPTGCPTRLGVFAAASRDELIFKAAVNCLCSTPECDSLFRKQSKAGGVEVWLWYSTERDFEPLQQPFFTKPFQVPFGCLHEALLGSLAPCPFVLLGRGQ